MASTELQRLNEDLRLANARCSVTATQKQQMEEQLLAAQTALAAAQAELAELKRRTSSSDLELTNLHQSVAHLQQETCRCVRRECYCRTMVTRAASSNLLSADAALHVLGCLHGVHAVHQTF